MSRVALPPEAQFVLDFANADWGTPWLEAFRHWRANGESMSLDRIAAEQDLLCDRLRQLSHRRLRLSLSYVTFVVGAVNGDIQVSAVTPQDDVESALIAGLLQLKPRPSLHVIECVACKDFFVASRKRLLCGGAACSDSKYKREQTKARVDRLRAPTRASREAWAKRSRARCRQLPALIAEAYRGGRTALAEQLRQERQTLKDDLRRLRSGRTLAQRRGRGSVKVVVGSPRAPVPPVYPPSGD